MNEDKQIQQSIFKLILPYLIIGILIVIALFYFKGCNDNPQVNTKPDTTILNDFLNRKGIEFKKLISDNKTLNDSLKTAKKTKIKIVYRTKTVYDSLIINDTSCVNSLITLYNECQKIDSINNVIIDNLSTQNANLITATNNQQDVIDMQNYKIKQDSIFIKDEFPKEYKRGLKKGRKQGIIIGAAIETAVIVGGLILVN